MAWRHDITTRTRIIALGECKRDGNLQAAPGVIPLWLSPCPCYSLLCQCQCVVGTRMIGDDWWCPNSTTLPKELIHTWKVRSLPELFGIPIPKNCGTYFPWSSHYEFCYILTSFIHSHHQRGVQLGAQARTHPSSCRVHRKRRNDPIAEMVRRLGTNTSSRWHGLMGSTAGVDDVWAVETSSLRGVWMCMMQLIVSAPSRSSLWEDDAAYIIINNIYIYMYESSQVYSRNQ